MKSEHERAIRRALNGLVEIVSLVDHKGHIKMTVKHEEHTKTFSISGSPKDLGGCIKEVVRDVRRFMKGQYR